MKRSLTMRTISIVLASGLFLALLFGASATAREDAPERAGTPAPPTVHSPAENPPRIELPHPDAAPADRDGAASEASGAPTVEWTFHKTAGGGHPDGEEQQVMWLMNRARSDPTAEGIWLATTDDPDVAGGRDYFNVDTTMLQNEFASYDAKPPAAFDLRLYNAAKAHSDDLIARDAQDHDGQYQRVIDAGFAVAGYRGSVFAYADSGLNAHAAWNIDWGGPVEEGGMQTGRGHRMAVMSIDGDYTNVGIAAVPDNDPGTDVGPLVTTGNYCYANTSVADHYNRFIVGTVWDDADGDDMYDPGEGIGGVTVMPDAGTFYAVTGDSGGYAIPITAPGTYQVTFSGGSVPTEQKTAVVADDSVLLDYVTSGAAPTNQPPSTPSSPSIADGATDVSLNPTLTWSGGDPDGDTVTYTVSFGDSSPPPFAATTLQTSYAPGALAEGTRYYWRISASDGVSESVSSIWSFTTTMPRLQVFKTVDTGGLSEVPLGGVVTYTVVISNPTSSVEAGVVMSDPLPSAIDSTTWLEQDLATLAAGVIEWGPHDVLTDTSHTIKFTAQVSLGTSFLGADVVNTAYLDGTDADPDSDSATFSIEAGRYFVYLPVVLQGADMTWVCFK